MDTVVVYPWYEFGALTRRFFACTNTLGAEIIAMVVSQFDEASSWLAKVVAVAWEYFESLTYS
jgi:hypothetical protein